MGIIDGVLNVFRKKEEKREGITLEELIKKEGLSIFDMGSSHAGVSVTESTAQTYMAFFSCARVISESIATLPIKTYLDNENKEIAKRQIINMALVSGFFSVWMNVFGEEPEIRLKLINVNWS